MRAITACKTNGCHVEMRNHGKMGGLGHAVLQIQTNQMFNTTLNFRIGQSKPAGLQNPLSSSSLIQKEKKKEKEKTKDRQAYFNFSLSLLECVGNSGVSSGQCCLS